MALGFKRGPKRVLRKFQIVKNSSIVMPSMASGRTGGGWEGRYTEDYDEYQNGSFSASMTLSANTVGMKCTAHITGGYSGRTPYGGCYCNITIGGQTYSGSSIDRTVTFTVTNSNRTISMSGRYEGESRMWVPATSAYVTDLICEEV